MKRGAFEMIVDLLEYISRHTAAAKTRVVGAVGIDQDRAIKILSLLEERGFIIVSKRKYCKKVSVLELTDRGMTWLVKAKQLLKELGLK